MINQQTYILICIGIIIFVKLHISNIHKLKQQPKKENFSFGGKKKSKKEILRETVNETIIDSFMKAQTTCSTSSSIDQNIDIVCDPTPELLQINKEKLENCQAFVTNLADKFTAEELLEANSECIRAHKACIISDVKQEAVIKIDASCQVTSEMTQNTQEEMIKTLTDKSKNTEDGFTGALNSAIDGYMGALNSVADSSFGGSSSEEFTDSSKIINSLSQTVTQETLQEMVNSFNINQDIKIGGADSEVRALSQKAGIDVVAKLTSGNKVLQDLEKYIDLSEVNESETTQRGVTDVADTAGETVVGVTDSVTGMVGGIFTDPTFMIGCVLVMFAMIGAAYMFAKAKVPNAGGNGGYG